MARIKIKAEKKTIQVSGDKGELIADLVLGAGFFIERPCAGRGRCGKCRVRAKGDLSKPGGAERKILSKSDLNSGLRLACQARISGDAEISLPTEAVVTDKIFSGAYPVEKLKGPFGIAVDLGTTTVAAFLATLRDGIIHKGNAVLNQQAGFGAEVISRMEAAYQGKSQDLKKLARESIEEAISGLGLSKGQLKEIKRAVVVGNSAMHHLLLGLAVDHLMRLPFQPFDREARKIKTRVFGTEVQVWVPPLIGGFVGSDALACLIYLGFATRKKPMAAVDLGTNGEVMMTDGKKILVASTAAGPAFEGVNIECGMRAGKGAISLVKRSPDKSVQPPRIKTRVSAPLKMELEVIGGGKAKGIAGSGLLSLVNLFRKEGKIDASGRMAEGKIFLNRKVYLSQSDVREVQKAKAAIRAAMEVLLLRLKLKAEDLEELVLTGSFGARIEKKDAVELGLTPSLNRDRIKVFANGAGMGCGMMLRKETFEFASELAGKVEHIELFADQEFMNRFIGNMRL